MNKFLQNPTHYLVIVLLICILILILARLVNSPASFSLVELSPLAITTGVLVAIITYSFNQRRSASEDYLKNSIDLLSRAYDVLVSTKDDQNRPLNNRKNWLTSARLIKASENISHLITEESHISIWNETEEYWRGKFSDLINPQNKGFTKEYYAESAQHMLSWGGHDREPLSIKSLAVLYRFAQWNPEREDSIKGVLGFTRSEIDHMLLAGPQELGELLDETYQINTGKKPFDSTLIK